MAWSIEVAAVRRDSLTEAVPSGFTSTGMTLGVEQAASRDRFPKLCAMDLLTLQTGVLFHQDLGEVGFTLSQATGRPSERNASPSRVTTADS